MTQPRTSRFADFARRREEAAVTARLELFKTTTDRSGRFPLEVIGSQFTDRLLDGPFFQSPIPAPPVAAMTLTFVQSREGNTDAEDPSALGGGQTDKHVIYEGVTRVAADAVLAGARTVGDGNLLFSVWHPALVELRHTYGKPRHPVQIVATERGALPIEHGLMFNTPEVPVLILSAGASARRLADITRSRPWLAVVSSGDEPNVRRWAERLRQEFGIRRISAVGGRTLATSLIDAGLVRDLYLTTSPFPAGRPDTPFYSGTRFAAQDLVVSKRSAEGVVFEHFVVRTHRGAVEPA